MFRITTENRGNARRLVQRLHPDFASADIWAMSLARLTGLVSDALNAGKVTASEVVEALTGSPVAEAEPVVLEAAKVRPVRVADATSDVASALGKAIEAALAAHGPKAPAIDEAAILAHVDGKVSEVTKQLIATVSDAIAAIEKRAPRAVEVIGPQGIARPVQGRTHVIFDKIVKALSVGVHVWLVGPSGSGKSHVARQAAEGLGRRFYSTGAISTKHELIGYVKPSDGVAVRTPLRDAFELGGVFSWDDVDASNAAALVAFNEITSNDSFAFPDGMVQRHPDFVAIASSNTWGTGATSDYVGRTRIDEATRKRFAFFLMDYDESLERDLAGNDSWTDEVQAVRRAVRELGLKVLITPRQTFQGAKLLAAGLSWSDVQDATVYAGLDAPTAKQIRDKVGAQGRLRAKAAA